jgi:hypothetical protein
MSVSFPTTMPFDEIQLTISSLASVLQTYYIYNAFIVKDSDNDGTPDCMDRCCLGPDYIVGDDGIPTACSVNLSYDNSCILCPVTISMTGGAGVSPSKTYALYKDDVKISDFQRDSITITPDTTGIIVYTLKADDTEFIKYIPVSIHPAAVTWKTASENNSWQHANNWTAESGTGYPIWCTDVTIPENAATYPILTQGDECRDITFKNGASVGKIHYLHYRHAFVEFNPDRNTWKMASAPLRYMYSADYSADMSWGNAIAPKIFLRQFDVEYSDNIKTNPDGTTGTSNGNFSLAFANLQVPLNAADGFALWVNGSPTYNDENFVTGTPYLFPRRNAADSTDVEYSYHLDDGTWTGNTFFLERGNDIKGEGTWTAESNPDKNNRFRFIFEGSNNLNATDSTFFITVQGATTVIVGNPFMSHLDFNRFYTDNEEYIYNYYRTWDGESFYTYLSENTSGTSWPGLNGLTTNTGNDDTSLGQYIAPMQAFFVDTKDVSNTELIFTPLASTAIAKTATQAKAAKMNTNILRLILNAGDKSNAAIIVLANGASETYQEGEDIFKLFSPQSTAAEIYTIADGTAIEINVSNIENGNTMIPIGIKAPVTKTMQMTITGAENMDAETEVVLIDRKENKKYDLKEQETIYFEKESEENLEGRFYISFKKDVFTTDIENNANFANEIQVFINDGYITVSSNEEIKYLKLYDLSGKIIYSLTDSGKYMERFAVPKQKGIYILKVDTIEKTEICKIIF